jgi:hypothetical protein
MLGPYEPIEGYRVAIIDDAGIPVELIETTLTDEEIWGRAKSGNASIYRVRKEVTCSVSLRLGGALF